MTGPGGGRELGYAGMVAAGIEPREAWASIRAECSASPEVRAIIDDLGTTDEGRAALEYARQAWARHGLPAPFDDLPAG